MTIYIAWFLISIAFLFFTLKSSKSTQNMAMAFFMIALGVFVGLGDMLGGYDRYIYGEIFDGIADYRLLGLNPFESDGFLFYKSEFGYGTIQILISYLTANRYIYIFIFTMLVYVLMIISLRRYVENTPFAVVMFMGLWFFFTFTYLRQAMACTVCWLAVKYIIERRPVPFFILAFIAYSIHNSTIIFAPMYFLPIKKFPIKWVIGVMVAALIVGLSPIPQGLFSTYGDVNEIRHGVEDYERDAGFRWAYLIEAVFFLFVIIANYKHIVDRRKEITMLNLALVFCAILLIFVRSENGGRLGWALMIGVICTMTNLCIDYKTRKMFWHGSLMLVVSFLLFYRILTAWGSLVYPYKTFFTDGFRDGDVIHEKYEYDPSYDVDKFYR